MTCEAVYIVPRLMMAHSAEMKEKQLRGGPTIHNSLRSANEATVTYLDAKALAKTRAIDLYSKAAAQAPNDPKPHSNLSAAHFEIGNYRQCIVDISNALSISGDADSDLTEKLLPRIIKSRLHVQDVQAAEAARNQPKDHPNMDKFATACTNIDKARKSSAQAVQELIHGIPRYLSTLDDNPEYYAAGHDTVCSQVDDGMMRRAANDPISFFFGGIGDARNLYATLIDISRFEGMDKGPSKRKYHMTVNDLKASMLARNLVMFYLLDDLSNMTLSGSQQEIEHLTVIFYVYIGAIVPPFVAQKLRETIKRAANALCSGDDLLTW
ncbi:MAG: hypothetical protein Q9183_004624, partial [Haloplaca sp. 2 TL-2023]